MLNETWNDLQHSFLFSTPERGKGPAELALQAAVQDSTVAPPGMLIPKSKVLPAAVSLSTNRDQYGASRSEKLPKGDLRVTPSVIPHTGIDFQSLNDRRSRSSSAIKDVQTAWPTTSLVSVSAARHCAICIVDLFTRELNDRVTVYTEEGRKGVVSEWSADEI